ncbi:hypothetical protein D6D20_02909 [Aureobasidium pullulans]|uniref:SprT-like domain-containing protein n=1 Tax=Aureobasidium pullulans TaxID=5580 RepID=A0A4S8ZEF0_AURPU|nr:hypothetical protein D6D20_02909 [Aureobasidium pullulans]
MSSSTPPVGQYTPPAYNTSRFKASTFDPRTIPKKTFDDWTQDPDLVVFGQPWPDPSTATTAREYCRRLVPIQVSPSVFKLGKHAYPVLKQRRYASNRLTPEYDYNKPWMGDRSYILKLITPKKLLDLGCINIDTSDTSPISPQFRIDYAAAAKASKDRNVSVSPGSEKNIHPLLRRRQFRNTSDWEYEHLKPTLRIVSMMLETSSVLDMLHALGSKLHKKPGTKMFPRDVWVYYTGRSTHMDRAETALETIKMAKFMYFTWMSGDDSGASAITSPLKTPGLRPNGVSRACKIKLDDEWRYLLTDGKEMLASLCNPEAEDESAFLRIQLLAANTILHELAHAFYFNTATGRWPGAARDVYQHLIKKSFAKDGVKHETEYMVFMEYVRQFFCDEFWEGREMRYETTPLSDFAVVGVRLLFSSSRNNFDSSESPTVDKHDDHNIGEFLPNLMESAIVYKHEAFTFAEEKIEGENNGSRMKALIFGVPKKVAIVGSRNTADGESESSSSSSDSEEAYNV